MLPVVIREERHRIQWPILDARQRRQAEVGGRDECGWTEKAACIARGRGEEREEIDGQVEREDDARTERDAHVKCSAGHSQNDEEAA